MNAWERAQRDHTDCCYCNCISVNLSSVNHCEPDTTIRTVTCVPVIVVVNSLTLMHYQHTDLGHLLVPNFRYRLICESLTLARFSAAGMGVSLYAGRLTCEYIRFSITNIQNIQNATNDITTKNAQT